MFDLELTEDQQLIRETVVAFAQDEIRPIARDCDERCAIPPTLGQKGFELGLIHSSLPESVGGFGENRSAVTGVVVAEELGYGDLAIALHLLAPRLAAFPILDLGDSAQHQRWLPRFARQFHPATAAIVEPRFDFDLTRFSTTARREGDSWILNGAKAFVPLADAADLIVVLASLPDGKPGAFVVERDTAGISIAEPEKNMGFKALSTFEIGLTDVRIPLANRLGTDSDDSQIALERVLNFSRLAMASLAIGLARGAFHYARDYAKDRRAFGVAIAQKQAIAFMLADMATEIDAARLLVWEAAAALDKNRGATREVCLARRYASNMALKATDSALQILGGHGYVRDHPVELWLRNGRSFGCLDGLAIL